ncbi:type II toxin-antitoxin system prevent-host-death family antitoxin [Nocardioides limicola]|uniref:type II toxin-antitoxin system prevent-host-death family antitoxin n=1 Tax=Nocardioides limicola TaxID=2803368 RepID=UPI00193B4252|nr:type II toxin-antitoxin system prevent-host-death family antitoxin [Nocardioides sp. DJM-14]
MNADWLSSGPALSVTDAAGRGAALFKDAEDHDVIVARRGRPVAAVVSMERLEAIRTLEADVRSASIALSRLLDDEGVRHSLDDVIAGMGFSRAELEAELDADIAAGRG